MPFVPFSLQKLLSNGKYKTSFIFKLQYVHLRDQRGARTAGGAEWKFSVRKNDCLYSAAVFPKWARPGSPFHHLWWSCAARAKGLRWEQAFHCRNTKARK